MARKRSSKGWGSLAAHDDLVSGKTDYNSVVDVVPSEDELQAPKLVGRPTWRALQQLWNRLCSDPKWPYEGVRNFRRAFLSAARVMLRPPYGDLWLLSYWRSGTLP
jgi:hypothetical protein